MSEAPASRQSARPLRTAALRRAVLAPELERYLSRKNVDLAVTDQIEAVEVRVRKGIEVLERKVADGLRVGRRRLLALGLLAAAPLVLLLLSTLPRTIAIVVGLEGAIAVAALPLFLDYLQLRRLQSRHVLSADCARSLECLLELAEKALAEARRLGATGREG